MDERLRKLHDMINNGIDEVTAKGSLDKDTICIAGQLVDIKKDIVTINDMENSDYSEKRPVYYMNDGVSYARRGRDGDGDGRYSENRYNDSNYSRGYSRRYAYGRGYSRADGKDQMIEHLEQAMEQASSEQEREAIRRMIVQAENG